MVIKYLPVREDSGDVSLREFQRRMTEIGRIRLGVFNPNKGNRGAPDKLSTFRFTSGMAEPIVKIADLYGGEARQYTPQRGRGRRGAGVRAVAGDRPVDGGVAAGGVYPPLRRGDGDPVRGSVCVRSGRHAQGGLVQADGAGATHARRRRGDRHVASGIPRRIRGR
jgi:hypothetical protein